MAASTVLGKVDEYLRTVYRPDRDYVDGEVLERSMGETPHARLQGFFTAFLRQHEDEWDIEVLPEQRLQISPSRYRIPDVMAIALPNLDDRIVRTPPLLCIEILSSEDRIREIEERLEDYASIGVRAMWVIDPWRGTASAVDADGILREVTGLLAVPNTLISITVAEIFAELERLEQRARRAR